MIALLPSLIGLWLGVVAHKLRVILVRLRTDKAIVALEAATQRPAIIRASGRSLLSGGQMPLAKGVSVVAVLQQDFREHPILEWNVAVATGMPVEHSVIEDMPFE